MKKSFLYPIIVPFFTLFLGAWAVAAEKPLVDLDAAALPEGTLTEWANAGSLGGAFKSAGAPQAKTLDGVKAVEFGGQDHFLADFRAPTSITGDKPWTVIVRTRCKEIRGERALVAWADRPNNCLEIEYGDALLYGAVGTWNDPNTLGWTKAPPETGKWHTLIYAYAGGQGGELQAWCDGEMLSSKKVTLATKPDRAFVIGACQFETAPGNYRYEHAIIGAIASVRVYDRAFSGVEVWNASGQRSAFAVSPMRDCTLDTLSAELKWLPGSPEVASFDVYLATNSSVLDKAANSPPVGLPNEFKNVFKGNQPVSKTSYGPLRLNLRQTYYWRVDQRDAAGKVTPGAVSRFSTEHGNATDPVPADGYIFVEGGKQVLNWKPGKYAVRQNIYFGDSAAAVVAAKTPAVRDLAPAVTSVPLARNNPVPGKITYWRVESVNAEGLPVTRGDVWSVRLVKKKVKVYLVAGQSNAVGCSMVTGMPAEYKGFNRNVIIFVRGECRLGRYGWAYLRDGLGSGFGDRDGKGTIGPELTFGYEMAPGNSSEVIAIIKIAWGGTNLGIQWRPPGAGGETGPLYKDWVAAYHEAMASLDPAFEPELAGMLWMQGESDTGDSKMANEYRKNLTAFIKDIRTETKSPNLPFVLATISNADAWKAYGNVVRAAEADVAKTVPFTATFLTADYGMCDPWHYDTPGMVSLGQRFAKAMKELEKKR
jgi:hypothetical protein